MAAITVAALAAAWSASVIRGAGVPGPVVIVPAALMLTFSLSLVLTAIMLTLVLTAIGITLVLTVVLTAIMLTLVLTVITRPLTTLPLATLMLCMLMFATLMRATVSSIIVRLVVILAPLRVGLDPHGCSGRNRQDEHLQTSDQERTTGFWDLRYFVHSFISPDSSSFDVRASTCSHRGTRSGRASSRFLVSMRCEKTLRHRP